MRGKDTIPQVCAGDGRITPACAGKRVNGRKPAYNMRDHPRMCGEKPWMGSYRPRVPGSPPHVRGKAKLCGVFGCRRGITPACAGKRGALRRRGLHAQDHPRMCGEKCGAPAMGAPCRGSPPHVRGKGLSGKNFTGVGRITPACAGKSCGAPAMGAPCRDHPRMCGEKAVFQRLHLAMLGSPPHVRGKVCLFLGLPR